MILKVLGSSSSGNGYILQASNNDSLILEAGVPFRDVIRALDYNRTSVIGCLYSHTHTDHHKFVAEYEKEGINIIHDIPERKFTKFGDFSVLPFSVHHDVPNNGYVIRHHEIGSLLFATDCDYIPTAFRGIRHFLIEANYSSEQLLLSDTDNAQKKRIMNSHMSLETCTDYLRSCNAHEADTITLIHPSSRHSDADAFKKHIEQTFAVPCYIARKGMTLNITENVSDTPNQSHTDRQTRARES